MTICLFCNHPESCEHYHPGFSTVQDIGIEIPKETPSVSVSSLPVTWRFSNKEQDTEISVHSNFFAFEQKQYRGFEAFFQRLSATYNHFVITYKPSIIKRIGLRYINQIHIPDGNPFDWTNLTQVSHPL